MKLLLVEDSGALIQRWEMKDIGDIEKPFPQQVLIYQLTEAVKNHRDVIISRQIAKNARSK
jgi:hypothetical protein